MSTPIENRGCHCTGRFIITITIIDLTLLPPPGSLILVEIVRVVESGSSSTWSCGSGAAAHAAAACAACASAG